LKLTQLLVLAVAPDATFSNWFLKYLVRGASKPSPTSRSRPSTR
jgi:hypothetical protein